MAIQKYNKNDQCIRLNELFTVGDFFINDEFENILLDDRLVELITECAKHFGKKPRFPTRNSLYRTKESNAKCGGARGSKHMKGIAADFMFDGVTRYELARFAETLTPESGGIGVYGGKNEHIHLDTREGKQRWWIRTSNSRTPGFGGVPVVFRKGHRSPAIKDIQKYLMARGYKCAADGTFGANTEAALSAFQFDHSIDADGAYGRQTNAVTGLFRW